MEWQMVKHGTCFKIQDWEFRMSSTVITSDTSIGISQNIKTLHSSYIYTYVTNVSIGDMVGKSININVQKTFRNRWTLYAYANDILTEHNTSISIRMLMLMLYHPHSHISFLCLCLRHKWGLSFRLQMKRNTQNKTWHKGI